MTREDVAARQLTFPVELALVAAGGAAGAGLRYLATEAAPIAAAAFPTTTFVINVAGAFALGALLATISRNAAARWWVRPALGTGCLGAMTTISTFAVETIELTRADHVGLAVAYVIATIAAGVAAAAAGLVAAGWRPWRPVPDDAES